MNNHVTVLEIDLNAVNHNLQYLKSKLKKTTKVAAVVKAYGYGSDSVIIADFLKDKVDYFAVAYTQEGVILRNAGIKTPIIVLHPQQPNLDLLIENCLEPNLYSFKILNAFINTLKTKKLKNYPIHIKFNTGLNRLGFVKKDLPELISILNSSDEINLKSAFSHLAASEDLNEKAFSLNQISSFKEIKETLNKSLKNKPFYHMLNTSGVINFAEEAQFEMVRIGIGLYGFGNDESITPKLKNVISLKSIISQIHTIKKGESIGYNRAYKAQKTIKSATIPIGHADGIHRALGNGKGFVTINNKKAFIIGNVCMDMIMVDVTNIKCIEGDEVILFNTQETINEIATKLNSISYEIITTISQRIKRIVK